VSALAYIHSLRIVHADFGLHNFLLRDDGGIVLCDFAGSGLNGKPCYVAHGVRYANPLSNREYPTEEEDVFALGTVLYELDRGELLSDGMDREEIYMRLRDRQFPDLSMVSLPLRGVIEKCWTVPKYKASDALKELGKS
jgi:serine/threonine protein kinase